LGCRITSAIRDDDDAAAGPEQADAATTAGFALRYGDYLKDGPKYGSSTASGPELSAICYGRPPGRGYGRAFSFSGDWARAVRTASFKGRMGPASLAAETPTPTNRSTDGPQRTDSRILRRIWSRRFVGVGFLPPGWRSHAPLKESGSNSSTPRLPEKLNAVRSRRPWRVAQQMALSSGQTRWMIPYSGHPSIVAVAVAQKPAGCRGVPRFVRPAAASRRRGSRPGDTHPQVLRPEFRSHTLRAVRSPAQYRCAAVGSLGVQIEVDTRPAGLMAANRVSRRRSLRRDSAFAVHADLRPVILGQAFNRAARPSRNREHGSGRRPRGDPVVGAGVGPFHGMRPEEPG